MLIPFYWVSQIKFIGNHSVILHEYSLPLLFSPLYVPQNPAFFPSIIDIEGRWNIPSQCPMFLNERLKISYADLSPYPANRESLLKIDRISLLCFL